MSTLYTMVKPIGKKDIIGVNALNGLLSFLRKNISTDL